MYVRYALIMIGVGILDALFNLLGATRGIWWIVFLTNPMVFTIAQRYSWPRVHRESDATAWLLISYLLMMGAYMAGHAAKL